MTTMQTFKIISCFIVCIIPVHISQTHRSTKQQIDCNWDIDQMMEYERTMQRIYNLDFKTSYSDTHHVISQLSSLKNIQNEKYLRPLIESFIQNDDGSSKSVKTFYDEHFKQESDFKRKRRLRCIVENFIDESEAKPNEERMDNLMHHIKQFSLSNNKASTFNQRDKDAKSKSVLRDFFKMMLSCPTNDAFGCVYDGVVASLQGSAIDTYVNKLGALIDTVDNNEKRATSTKTDDERMEVIREHLKQIFTVENPTTTHPAKYLSNIDKFASNMVLYHAGSDAQNVFKMIYNIVRNWKVEIDALMNIIGSSNESEQFARSIYLRFLNAMQYQQTNWDIFGDLTATVMESQLSELVTLRVREQDTSNKWLHSMTQITNAMNPNLHYSDHWLLNIRWNALVKRYRNDVYLQSVQRLKERSIECEVPLSSECLMWYNWLQELQNTFDADTNSWTSADHLKALS